MALNDCVAKKGVLIAEDHDLYGDGVSLVVQKILPNVEIFRARDIQSSLLLLREKPSINLALVDLKMPDANGLDGINAIKCSYPTLTIVVISSLDFETNVRNIMNIGVNGFISKASSKATMLNALDKILQGDIVVEPELPQTQSVMLSTRQQQTLNFMAQGKTNKEIARALNISPHTAKEYVSKILQLFDAENRTQAVQYAETKGLLLANLNKY